jgi:hypothetical protein
MLYLYRPGIDKIPDNLEVVHDVERKFAEIKIKDTPLIRQLLWDIERGKYIDATSFEDMFKVKLTINLMSTGCKAALIIATEPECVVDLIECGQNAKEFIVKHCKNGHAIASNCEEIDSFGSEVQDIDVKIGNREFTKMDDLNDYLDTGRAWNGLL